MIVICIDKKLIFIRNYRSYSIIKQLKNEIFVKKITSVDLHDVLKSLAICIAAEIALKIIPNAITKAEEAANNCINAAASALEMGNYAKSKGDETAGAAEQLLSDIQSGLFQGEKGDKGDKGDPSTVDKIGTADSVIDLSDLQNAMFGTLSVPIVINGDTGIVFTDFANQSGYQKSFILNIKRTAEAVVTWPANIIWSYGEMPLLPVGSVQKILFETSDGIIFFGTAGDYFNA